MHFCPDRHISSSVQTFFTSLTVEYYLPTPSPPCCEYATSSYTVLDAARVFLVDFIYRIFEVHGFYSKNLNYMGKISGPNNSVARGLTMAFPQIPNTFSLSILWLVYI